MVVKIEVMQIKAEGCFTKTFYLRNDKGDLEGFQ